MMHAWNANRQRRCQPEVSIIDIIDIINDGVEKGYLTPVRRPDGEIGYALTDAGYAMLDEIGIVGGEDE